MSSLKSFVANEKGTETVEWGLMAGLIVGGLILTVAAIGTWVKGRFDQMKTDLGA
jgi:Flp pilus assembly pilin Flp